MGYDPRFSFYKSYYDATKDFPDEDARMRFIYDLVRYVFDGVLPDYADDDFEPGADENARCMKIAFRVARYGLEDSRSKSKGGTESGKSRRAKAAADGSGASASGDEQNANRKRTESEQKANRTRTERDVLDPTLPNPTPPNPTAQGSGKAAADAHTLEEMEKIVEEEGLPQDPGELFERLEQQEWKDGRGNPIRDVRSYCRKMKDDKTVQTHKGNEADFAAYGGNGFS